MNCRGTIAVMLLLGLVIGGCSLTPAPHTMIWTAHPEYAEMNHGRFNVRIEPRKDAGPYFTYFILTIVNKTDANLVVDWNASRYLFNGKPQGVFVFEGIDPATLKTATIPTETIRANKTFSKKIMPLRTIAWNPIKEQTAGGHGITPGILPAGGNGIHLVTGLAGERLTTSLSVRLTKPDTR